MPHQLLAYTALALLTLSPHTSAISLPRWRQPSVLSSTSSLHRRADNTTSTAISIGPSQYWEGDDGPWSTFPLQVGTGAVEGLQNVRVLVSTAATAIWTIGAAGCPDGYVDDCANSRGGLFLTNQSLTWSPDSIYQTGLEDNLGLDSSGYVGYDVATLGWQGSGAEVSDQHATIWNMADPRYWVGIFGLNPRPTNLTNFNNPLPSFLQTLRTNGKTPSLSWAYTAGAQYRLDGIFGSLTLGGYDANRFEANSLTFPFYSDISRDLTVNLQSITTSDDTDLLPSGSIPIFIDSTVASLYLPTSACTAFEKAFNLTWSTSAQRYLVSSSLRQTLLAANPSVTFKISPSVNGGKSVSITLPYAAFDLQATFPAVPKNVSSDGSSYYFPLQPAANATMYTLGRTFLQEAYLIADYDRGNFSVSQCTWSPAKVNSQNLVTIFSPSEKSSGSGAGLSTGAIAGIAVAAAVVIIALIALLIFFLLRKKKAKRTSKAEAELAAAKDPQNNGSDTMFAKHGHDANYDSTTELGSTNIHEAPTSARRAELGVGKDDTYYGGKVTGYSEAEGEGHLVEMDGRTTEVFEMQGSEAYEMDVAKAPGRDPGRF